MLKILVLLCILLHSINVTINGSEIKVGELIEGISNFAVDFYRVFVTLLRMKNVF